jgi:hypothetical protein
MSPQDEEMLPAMHLFLERMEDIETGLRAASKSRSQPAMVTERRGADSPSAYEDWVPE